MSQEQELELAVQKLIDEIDGMMLRMKNGYLEPERRH